MNPRQLKPFPAPRNFKRVSNLGKRQFSEHLKEKNNSVIEKVREELQENKIQRTEEDIDLDDQIKENAPAISTTKSHFKIDSAFDEIEDL